jgi:hypothetical protein
VRRSQEIEHAGTQHNSSVSYDNVDKIVTALLGKNVKELQPIFPKLFKKQTTDAKFERIVTSAPFGDVPQKPEGEEYATDLISRRTRRTSPRSNGA